MPQIISIQHHDSVRILKDGDVFYPQFIKFQFNIFRFFTFKYWSFFYSYTPEYSQHSYHELQPVGFYRQSNATSYVINTKKESSLNSFLSHSKKFFSKKINSFSSFFIKNISIFCYLFLFLLFLIVFI